MVKKSGTYVGLEFYSPLFRAWTSYIKEVIIYTGGRRGLARIIGGLSASTTTNAIF